MTTETLTLGERLRATKALNEEQRLKRETAKLASETSLISEYFHSVSTTWSEDILAARVPEDAVIPLHIAELIDPDGYGARIHEIANPAHRFNGPWQALLDWARAEGLGINLEFSPNDANSCDLVLMVDVADFEDSSEPERYSGN